MSKIQMLNLFRCSSVGNKMVEKDIHYFVTDYFDGIKVEDLDPGKATLEECMGIKRGANKHNIGISHQRYCLYSEKDEEEDIFEINQEFPLLTVIQVFINPDIYQAERFLEDGKDISCGNCMDKVQEYVRGYLGNGADIHWKIYRLLTAGDFAVIVRSKRIHDAYDISTLIRSICVVAGESDKRTAAFFTYSISGVLDKCMDSKDIYESIDWAQYLDSKDRVIVRIVYNHAYNREKVIGGETDEEIKETLLALGYRLLGRYDYQVECSPYEFQKMYTYIRNYKFGTDMSPAEDLGKVSDPKTKGLLWMMKEGHVLRINEKIFLYYEKDPLLKKESIKDWKVIIQGEWISLYEYNEENISRIKVRAGEIERELEPFYQSERNLKEYARLLGRFCRVLREINQMHELRISTANLSRQLGIMVASLQRYLGDAQANQLDNQTVASRISEYLHLGINDLEIFARYIRNINLQTLQTPNYDLQTNMCIEKILLAYSQFLRPFLEKQEPNENGKRPYYFSGTLYPIVVPNMGVKDLSVCVLFDDYHLENENQKEKVNEKLMVVNNPTFSYLCETCFLLPAVFHEIAHQFRYETREKRNDCLEAYIMKKIIYATIIELLDEDDEYGFDMEEEKIEKVVDDVYKTIERRMVSDKIRKKGLQQFKLELEKAVQELFNVAQKSVMPRSIIKIYFSKTKGDVRRYSADVVKVIENIEDDLKELERNPTNKSGNNNRIFDQILKSLENYFEIQEKQIFGEIIEIIKKIIDERKQVYGESQELVKVLEEFCDKSWEDRPVEKKGMEIFQLWKKLEKISFNFVIREDLRSLLKHYHNLYNAYQEFRGEWNFDRMNRKIPYQIIFENMSVTMYKSLLNVLDEFDIERNQEFEWDAIPLKGEHFEQLKRRIKFEREDGIKRRLKRIFSTYQGSRIDEFINNHIELYREITSDLFMCSMMGLDLFGYLVIAAENFAFNSDNELALYRRVSLVLQCLCKSRDRRELDSEKFSEELLKILCCEFKILRSECMEVFEGGKEWNPLNIKLEEIKEYIESLLCKDVWTTTQAWILRIFLQISYIIFNIKDTRVACEEIGEKEIWKDLVSEDSYIERKEIMKELLCKNGGVVLCGNIAEILNSPASYFNSKKYLLTDEIKFILLHYEKNCSQIFRENNKGE